MIDFGNHSVRLRKDGALLTEYGLVGFPEDGVWTSDDRILAFCSQESGGISKLIFHGSQPQSANAFLLKHPKGALTMEMLTDISGEKLEIHHRFENVTIMPFGWDNKFSSSGLNVFSRFCAQGSHLVWEVRYKNNLQNSVMVSPVLHLNPSGLEVNVNGQRVWQEPKLEDGAIYLSARDQLQTSTWIDVPGFKDIFIDSETFLLIAGENDKAVVREFSVCLEPEAILSGCWGQPRSFFIICGRSESLARDRLSLCRNQPDRSFHEQSERYKSITYVRPELKVNGYHVAEATYKLAPIYAEATKVQGTGALRSSAGGYYFVWGWDSLMGGHDLIRWGDKNAARDLINFVRSHHDEGGPVPHRFDNDLQPYHVTGFDFISQLFVSLLYHYYCETLDLVFLRSNFSFANHIFENLASQVDERGFYYTLGMYPDAPGKLGRTSKSLVAYEIGFWYCTCRMMEAMAGCLGEHHIARIAADLSVRVESMFLASFYDSQKGFLVDALVEPNENFNGTYPRYSLFPYHNSFGAWLLRPVQENISHFIQANLFKPDGIRMVPTWDTHIGTETVTGDCWFLHFDLYCLKVFRRAGDGGAIKRWLKLAESYITQRHVIPELQIMSSKTENEPKWEEITGQIWQLFAMSGWSRGLLEGCLGVEIDIGGITFIPCDSTPNGKLTNLPFRDGKWDIQVTGSGKWLEQVIVDGQIVSWTMKVPQEFYTPGTHKLNLHRTDHTPTKPLILEVVGGEISKLNKNGERLIFAVNANNMVNILFFCQTDPLVTIDGKLSLIYWDPTKKLGVINLSINGSVQVEIKGN